MHTLNQRSSLVTPLALTAVLLLATLPAQAEDNTASAPHLLGQHPAVLVYRRAPVIDANHFLVQPPASVSWTTQPEPAAVPRLAATPRRSGADEATTTTTAAAAVVSQR